MMALVLRSASFTTATPTTAMGLTSGAQAGCCCSRHHARLLAPSAALPAVRCAKPLLLPHHLLLPADSRACTCALPAAGARRLAAAHTEKSASGIGGSTPPGEAAMRRHSQAPLGPLALQRLTACARRRRHPGVGRLVRRARRQRGRARRVPAWSAPAACRAALRRRSRATPLWPPAGTPRWAPPCLAASPAAWQTQQSSPSGSWTAQAQRRWSSRMRPCHRRPTRSSSSPRAS